MSIGAMVLTAIGVLVGMPTKSPEKPKEQAKIVRLPPNIKKLAAGKRMSLFEVVNRFGIEE